MIRNLIVILAVLIGGLLNFEMSDAQVLGDVNSDGKIDLAEVILKCCPKIG